MVDIISMIVTIVVAALGGIAGYWGRIAQKLEDKREETYLENLPKIYSYLTALKEAINLFSKGGRIDNFTGILTTANKELRDIIFQANILIFKEDLHKDLYSLIKNTQNLEAVAEQVKEKGNTDFINRFQRSCAVGQAFTIGSLTTNIKEVDSEADKIVNTIKKELDGYSSVSRNLMILFGFIGGVIAAIEIIKGLFEA